MDQVLSKLDNKIAEAHYLTENEFQFMKFHIDAVLTLIDSIKLNTGLEGQWGLSEDCHWLVKIEKKEEGS